MVITLLMKKLSIGIWSDNVYCCCAATTYGIFLVVAAYHIKLICMNTLEMNIIKLEWSYQ